MIDLLAVCILIMTKFAIKLETDRRKIAALGLVHLPLVSICNGETAHATEIMQNLFLNVY